MPTDLSRETDRLDPAIWKIISVAVLGSLLSQLDATIVNVSETHYIRRARSGLWSFGLLGYLQRNLERAEASTGHVPDGEI